MSNKWKFLVNENFTDDIVAILDVFFSVFEALRTLKCVRENFFSFARALDGWERERERRKASRKIFLSYFAICVKLKMMIGNFKNHLNYLNDF